MKPYLLRLTGVCTEPVTADEYKALNTLVTHFWYEEVNGSTLYMYQLDPEYGINTLAQIFGR